MINFDEFKEYVENITDLNIINELKSKLLISSSDISKNFVARNISSPDNPRANNKP